MKTDFKVGDKVTGIAVPPKEEQFTVVHIDPYSECLNVLIKADYDDLEFWVNDTILTKVED